MIKPFTRRACMLLALILVGSVLSGCVVHLAGDNFFRPQGGLLSKAAIAHAELPAGYSLVPQHFAGADGTQLYGLLVSSLRACATVLYFGPQDFVVAKNGLDVAERLAASGVNGFVIDYRGYGQSDGKPSVTALESDATAAFDHVRAMPSLQDLPVVAHGVSMGSIVATSLVAERPLDGLVLVSAITNVRALVDRLMPWYQKLFFKVKLAPDLQAVNAAENLRTYHGPLLILAGSKDKATPASMARALLEAAATPNADKRLFVVKGAGHARELARPRSAPVYGVYGAFLKLVETRSDSSNQCGSPSNAANGH